MKSNPIIVKIPNSFFKKRHNQKEFEWNKENRPYLEGTIFSDNENIYFLPFTSYLDNYLINVKPNACVVIPSQKSKKAGMNIPKMIIIDKNVEFPIQFGQIETNQYEILKEKQDEVWSKAEEYILTYKEKVKENDGQPYLKDEYRFTTLQYFHEELGLPEVQNEKENFRVREDDSKAFSDEKGSHSTKQKIKRYTKEEIQKAENLDIEKVANSFGFSFGDKNKGIEHDSMVISRNTNTIFWNAHPELGNNKGLNPISFVRYASNYPEEVSFQDSVKYLLENDFQEVQVSKISPQKNQEVHFFNYKDFGIDPSSFLGNGFEQARDYLVNKRGLNPQLVDNLHKKDLIQATKTYGNLCFLWKDQNRNIVGGQVKPLKKEYNEMIFPKSKHNGGFHYDVGKPQTLIIAEGAISAISYHQFFRKTNVRIAEINGVRKTNAIQETIREFKEEFNQLPEEIILAFDNDEAGRNGAVAYIEKFCMQENEIKQGLSEKIKVHLPIGLNDWNDVVTNKNPFFEKENRISKPIQINQFLLLDRKAKLNEPVVSPIDESKLKTINQPEESNLDQEDDFDY